MTNNWAVRGCLIPSSVLLAIALLFMAVLWVFSPGDQPPKTIAQADRQIQKRMENLEKKLQDPRNLQPVDQDATISALFAMERAMQNAKNFDELTEQYILQAGSDRVSPDVQLLKYRFFNIYKKILKERDTINDARSLYDATTDTALAFFSAFDPVMLSVDRKQVQKLHQERMEKAKLKAEAKERLLAVQDEYVDFLLDYMQISAKHYREWDQLCAYRDRAYLANFEGNLEETISNAAKAVELAPYETEAHILLGMALLERGHETDQAKASGLLKDFLEKNPTNAAGLLLRGVQHMKQRQYDLATIDFDQAATYFPSLQETANDQMGIYKKRAFLNRSTEGRVIINAYRAMMAGSGYFSPDFQQARIYQMTGDMGRAKDKIFAHFFRRRQQGEWDKVLDDFRFSSKTLTTDLFCITQDGVSVNINLEEAFFTSKVILKVTNNGTTPLRNVTMLLCVRFTEMFKGDYVSFPVGETLASLPPGKTVEIGRRDITEFTKSHFGTEKRYKDIIAYAAVLISDEAILWIEPKELTTIMPDEPVKQESAQQPADQTSVIPPDLAKAAAETMKKAAAELKGKASTAFGKAVDQAISNAIDKTIETTTEKLTGSSSSGTPQQTEPAPPAK